MCYALSAFVRCSPLNAALCAFLKNFHSSALIIQT
nr:acetyltransferase [Vibrio cholerae]